MDFFNIIGCRRTSRPYRPNRLIGNYRILRRGNVRNGTVNLRRADIYGMTSITLCLGFADTDNNFQPGINRCLGFFSDQFIAFIVVGTAFGVPDNHILASEVLEHNRADVAGMRSRRRKMAVLRPKHNPGPFNCLLCRSQQGKRRTNQEFAIFAGSLFGFLGDAFGQSNAVFQKTVHFPVAGN